MKIKIIACGDTGVTLKAGERLAKMLDGVEVIDGRSKKFDLDADIYVLGTNVHFGKFNKQFIKLVNKLKDARIFVYISGAEVEKNDFYIEKARSLLPDALDIRYVWGELSSAGKPFFKRFAIQSFIDGRKKDGLPKPQILDKELRYLKQSIKDEVALTKLEGNV